LLNTINILAGTVENLIPCKERQVYEDALQFLVELQIIKSKEIQ